LLYLYKHISSKFNAQRKKKKVDENVDTIGTERLKMILQNNDEN